MSDLSLMVALQSRMSKDKPATVAKTERIQKLSWQKLQYWIIAIMRAQHRNMVTYKTRNGKSASLNSEPITDKHIYKPGLWVCVSGPVMSLSAISAYSMFQYKILNALHTIQSQYSLILCKVTVFSTFQNPSSN